MCEWTRQELSACGELKTLGTAFCFTSLTRPLDPLQLWLEPYWYTLSGEQLIVLLEG